MTPESVILFDLPEGEPAGREFLAGIGHPARVCHGPVEHACPILTGAGCELVETAHGVVFELDLDQPQHRDILARYKEILRDDIPLRVVTSPDQAERHHDLLRGLKVWFREPAVGDLDALAAEVEAADRAL
jgi:hypothetical protein